MPKRPEKVREMSEDKKAGTFFITLILTVVLVVAFFAHRSLSAEGDVTCYQNWPAVRSWTAATTQVDDMMADRKLTVSECDNMWEIYEEARDNQARDEAKAAALRIYKK